MEGLEDSILWLAEESANLGKIAMPRSGYFFRGCERCRADGGELLPQELLGFGVGVGVGVGGGVGIGLALLSIN
jgi:hypothetical protein